VEVYGGKGLDERVGTITNVLVIFFWGAKCLVIFFGGNLDELVVGSSNCLDESVGGSSVGWQFKMKGRWQFSMWCQIDLAAKCVPFSVINI
jgi:hypothetical protein